MSKKTSIAQEIVLPHSQAKLDLYKNYLVNYLRVLTLTPFCSKIHLFDIYCGVGVYKDGNVGSPIITNNTIKEVNEMIQNLGKPLKPIAAYINDHQKEKIESVKKVLDPCSAENCKYEYFTKDADDMLDYVGTQVNSFTTKERSLVFIDPYGYSHIQRDKLLNLVKNEHTEILLFLPVMQMYRFVDIAKTDPDRACYEDLRKFIFSFFPASHKIHKDSIENIFEFIHEIKHALTFNDTFYTCAHYIERGHGNYYALFFITSNIYGLDKMVEAKWKLDPVKGRGFSQRKRPEQTSMFQDHFELVDQKQHLDYLRKLIIDQLTKRTKVSNVDLYEFTLMNEFKPMHAKQLLAKMVASKAIIATDVQGNKLSTLDGAFMDYNHFKQKKDMIFFKLNTNGTI